MNIHATVLDSFRRASALDWIERQKQTIEIRYDECDGWIIESISDHRWTGETLLDAIETAMRDAP